LKEIAIFHLILVALIFTNKTPVKFFIYFYFSKLTNSPTSSSSAYWTNNDINAWDATALMKNSLSSDSTMTSNNDEEGIANGLRELEKRFKSELENDEEIYDNSMTPMWFD
jgi:hypothetical protein